MAGAVLSLLGLEGRSGLVAFGRVASRLSVLGTIAGADCGSRTDSERLGRLESEVTGVSRGNLLLLKDGLDGPGLDGVVLGVSVLVTMAGAGCSSIRDGGGETIGADATEVGRVGLEKPGVSLGVLMTVDDGRGDTRVGFEMLGLGLD